MRELRTQSSHWLIRLLIVCITLIFSKMTPKEIMFFIKWFIHITLFSCSEAKVRNNLIAVSYWHSLLDPNIILPALAFRQKPTTWTCVEEHWRDTVYEEKKTDKNLDSIIANESFCWVYYKVVYIVTLSRLYFHGNQTSKVCSVSDINSLKKVSPHLWKQVLNPIQALITYIHNLVPMCWDLSFNLILYMLRKNAKWRSYGHFSDSKSILKSGN